MKLTNGQAWGIGIGLVGIVCAYMRYEYAKAKIAAMGPAAQAYRQVAQTQVPQQQILGPNAPLPEPPPGGTVDTTVGPPPGLQSQSVGPFTV